LTVFKYKRRELFFISAVFVWFTRSGKMKHFAVFVVLLIGSALSSPLSGSEYRWNLVPDHEGRIHAVDLNPIESELTPAFNPEADIVFLLFTRSNPTSGQRIILNNVASVRNSNFNPSHPTRFLVHGWGGNAGSTVNGARDDFLRFGNFNVVVVNWGVGAASNNYLTARNNVGPTGQILARMVDFLHANNFVTFPTIHLIGHSLGGHVIGMAGKAVTRGRIQVIMSLDPAGPLFSLNNPATRVAPTDGVYVEIIHTNGGLQGFLEPIGHADFFPNFGSTQPGCGTDTSGACAHERVVPFYRESINSVFTGRECQSFANIQNRNCVQTGRSARMGGPMGSVGARGIYFLATNAAAPFSLG
jgi:pancreatic triacylglycerol lipase